MKPPHLHLITRLLLLLPLAPFGALGSGKKAPPNVVIFFLDDSGYADFSPFGDPAYRTPNVDKLAAQGRVFTRFYIPQAICSASRSALLTGCYPGRTRVFGAHGPKERGLSPEFTTLAELLKEAGYATAHYGKWHCGDQEDTRPLARGFDEHAGLMYSNDMWRYHPKDPEKWGRYPLQYWENGAVKIPEVEAADQAQLTTWATGHAVDFIRRTKEEPFLLYVAHSMPHVPIYCSDKFLGKSGAGLYGDVIMELDWSLGEILQALEAAEIEEDTIVIMSSDNGPWAEYGNHAGVTPFREHKATGFDGGVRSAVIMRYPGQLEAGSRSDVTLCTIDLLPTLAHMTGADLPDHEIDGRNVWPLLAGRSEAHPHDYYAITTGSHLDAVITTDGKWKLHLPHNYRHVEVAGKDGVPGTVSFPRLERSLFDLENDPFESVNVLERYPETARKLGAIALRHKARFDLE